MARIPEADVERLKREVSLLRLLEDQGHKLVRQGKDFACRCPWHADDDTPSCVVSPSSNLWHCFGCDAGGSVIDWVMRWHKVSFRHAVELLQKDLAAAVPTGESATPPPASAVRKAAANFVLDAGEQALLDQVIGFYHETLLASPEALAYLDKRGLGSRELVERYRLGFANRTLAYRLPEKTVKAGAELRGALQRIGILRESGHEHLNGSIVVPLFDEAGNVVQAYGRKIVENLRVGTPKHLYLPGAHRGVFNRAGIDGCEEVILCEALLDALTFIHAGYTNVTSAYGVHGFTDELLAALKSCGCQRVLIAFDRDDAGERGVAELAPKLQAEGFAVFRLLFPKGMDANSYALSVQPATKSLGVVIRSAQWLGDGVAPTLSGSDVYKNTSFLAAASDAMDIATPSTAIAPELPPLPAMALAPSPEREATATGDDKQLVVTFGERRYRVRGHAKNTSFEVMKVNVMVAVDAVMFVDTLDLYTAKQRQAFAKQAAVELSAEESVIQRDLGKLLLQLEQAQDARLGAALQPKVAAGPTMSAAEHAAALQLLQSPNLIAQLRAGVEKIGVVGESANALVGYLACVSRKLHAPLAIIIQSTSAAGKSTLMDALLSLVPEEDRVHYSAMTGQSLFYLGETSVKHKILAIAEEEGVRQAAYALKVLQSQGELTIASTGKDPTTGQLVTQEYRVEGPVMLFLTTTAIDIDEELLNRCLVLTINESREQTRLIQQRQRTRRTLDGLIAQSESDAVLALHRNAQRLLRPLAVVNPFAEQLTFLDDRTRLRRDHAKYLTLIDSIALLHQYQRPVRTLHRGASVIEYIEVELADIALANELAHEVLGRSLDELPPQTRRLLGELDRLVAAHAAKQVITRNEVRLTRKELRDASGLSDTRLRLHLERLLEMEYLIAHSGKQGRRFVYELAFDGEVASDAPQLIGLIDVAKLAPQTSTTTATSPGESTDFAPGSPAVRSSFAVVSPGEEITRNANGDAACSESPLLANQIALFPEIKSASRRSRTASSLVAAL